MPLLERALLAAFLLLGGCSTSRRSPPPALPTLALDRFVPAMREAVEKAYAEAQAKPDDAGASGRLGMVLHAYDQYQAAAVCYERARALDPKSFQWSYYLGVVQSAVGRNAEATVAFRDALRLDRDYLPARIKVAEALLGMGELRESRETFEAVIKKYPQFAAAHYGLGRVRAAEGNIPAAVDHYRKACELSPDFGAAHYALALAYRRLGENAKALEHIAHHQKNPLGGAGAEDPQLDAVKALNTGALQHLKKAVSLEASGRLEQSAAEHETALQIDPKLVQAHINLITLYGRLHKPEKSAQHYQAAVALNPNIADMHYNFGVMLFSQHREREAAAAFRQAVENKPNYHLAHFHLGRLLLHKQRSAEAIAHFLQTLTPEDENTAGYMYALAAAYARSGNRPRALQYARQARDRAASSGQTQLLASIERDLRALEGRQ